MKTMMKLFTMMMGLILICFVSVNAQNEVVMPGGFVQHGHNSSDVATPAENTDSVAVGAVMQYWVQPDAAITGTNSTFAWTIAAAVGTQTGGSPTNLATVTMAGSPGTGTIQVVESSPAGCGSGSTTTINVGVIALPTVTYPAAGGNGSVCTTGTDGSLSAVIAAALNINWTSSVSGNRLLNLRYDLTGPAGFTNVTNHQVNITETGAGAGTFAVTETLTHYGTYTITLKDAADRVATKCNNMRNTNGITNTTYTFTVYRTPVTGPIYHIPNM
jgi:hypothetical protein